MCVKSQLTIKLTNNERTVQARKKIFEIPQDWEDSYNLKPAKNVMHF